MVIYFDEVTKGFYDTVFHKTIPPTAVEITAEQREYLRQGIRNGQVVKVIDGVPTLEDAPPLTSTEKIAVYRTAVGAHIDRAAQDLGFDCILTAVTYADEPADPVSQAQGQALREWRSTCWKICRETMIEWQNGGPEPTIDELISSLPEIVAE